jgi:type III secretion protein V
VNLGAGTAIGVLQRGMVLSEAAATYALIAVGDGLVSQLPSLCIALAAGLVVIRVASDGGKGSLGGDIAQQFFGQPKVLLVVAGLCAALCVIPGIPHLTFGLLALSLGVMGIRLTKEPPVSDRPASEKSEGLAESPLAAGVAPLRLDLSEDLTKLLESESGDWLKGGLERVRQQLYVELGVRPPPFRVHLRAAGLAEGTYRLFLDEVPLAQANLSPSGLYARCNSEDVLYLGIQGGACSAPSGEPLLRVGPSDREQLEAAGIPVLTPLDVVGLHLLELLRRHAALLLGLQEVRSLVDELESQAPALVHETLEKVPLALLTEVLRQLLVEEVSIRNLRAIFEALASPTTEGDAAALVERCRQGLHRYLSHKYAPEGPLFVYLTDPSVEELLRSQAGVAQALEPDKIERILENMRAIAEQGRAVVLTAPDTRRTLRRLCEGSTPGVAVLTYRELDPQLQIRPLGRLSAANLGLA